MYKLRTSENSKYQQSFFIQSYSTVYTGEGGGRVGERVGGRREGERKEGEGEEGREGRVGREGEGMYSLVTNTKWCKKMALYKLRTSENSKYRQSFFIQSYSTQ